MSRKHDDCGHLVRGAIALATGHRRLEFNEEKEKVVRFTAADTPACVIVKNKDKLVIWAKADLKMSSQTRAIAMERRTVGFDRSGNPAIGKNAGLHANVASWLDCQDLLSFNPQSLNDAWSVLEDITS
ncbi:hypothetical protein AAG612_15305 [Citromicrobium bathyomarinum]|uniref:hypothetical protein n=1 Tax=Citromicrobium bathyomarinum TaxID=72174 RepID=UPI00315A1402